MFDCPECHSVFHLREDSRHELLTDKCRLDFLELPKAKDDSKQIRRLKRWLDFFNVNSEEDADMLTQKNDSIMNKAVLILKEMSADERMREIARIREKALHDEASYLRDARNKGLAESRAEGRAEYKLEIMEKMLKQGFTEEQIQMLFDN